MRKFKKIIIYTIVCSMLLMSGVITTAFAATEDYTKEVNFLTTIGLNGVTTSSVNATATRGEAALFLAQALGMPSDSKASMQIFSDVGTDHSSAAAISYLYENNIVHGNTDGTFRPDSIVTFNEFAKMTTNALGYEEYANAKGGFSIGYLDCARSSGITSGVTSLNEFTKGKIYRMLYNMLHANKLYTNSISIDSQTGGNVVGYHKGEALMKEIYDVVKCTGVVIATETGTIDPTVSLEIKDYIMINHERFKLLKPSNKDYLGLSVDFYINDDNEILFITPSENTKTTIMYNDILSDSTTDKIGYITPGGKNKYLTVEGPYFSYNNVGYKPSNSELKPEYGKLELIDNNGNGKIDVVKIWDYKSYVTKSITNDSVYLEDKIGANNINDSSKKRTSFKYDDNSVTTILLDRANNKCEFTILDKNNVITVAESKNGELRTVFLSSDNFEGTLTEITTDSKALIDDYEYGIYPGVKLESAFNKLTMYYLDINETIIKTDDAKEEKYAVLYGVMEEGTFDKKLSVKLFENGVFNVYEFTDKIQLSENGGMTYSSKTNSEAYAKIKAYFDAADADPSNPGARRLIQFVLKDGKIDKFILADINPEYDEDYLRLNKTSVAGQNYSVWREFIWDSTDNDNTDGRNFVRWLPRSTYIYMISPTDEKKCSFGLMDNLIGSDQTELPNFQAYETTKVGVSKYIIVNQGQKMMADINFESDVAFISEMKTVVSNNGEPMKVYEAFTSDDEGKGAMSITLKTSDTELTNSERTKSPKYPEQSINFYDLEPGDVIHYKVDSLSGEVIGFSVITRKADLYSKLTGTPHDYSNVQSDVVTIGNVIAIDNDGLRLKADHITGPLGMDEVILTRTEEYHVRDLVCKWDPVLETFKMVTWDDIQVGMKVWNFTSSSYSWGGKYWIILE